MIEEKELVLRVSTQSENQSALKWIKRRYPYSEICEASAGDLDFEEYPVWKYREWKYGITKWMRMKDVREDSDVEIDYKMSL